MYKTSKETQERKDIKRQYIMETAAKVFAEHGYHNTSVKDIVDEAKVSVGSFYFYFKGKEELFSELYASITKEFDEKTEMVLDTENFGLAKNFTRAITVNLWLYQERRELAKIMLFEAAGLNPEFEKKRWEGIKKACSTMEEWFKRFKVRSSVNIPEESVAALAFEGTFAYLVADWLMSDSGKKLTDSAFALSVYNLQALKIPFEEEEIKKYVTELLDELNPKL